MVVVITKLIAIFKDAADLDAGESEDLLVDLKGIAILGFRLRDEKVFGLSDERDDRAVSMNGAGLNIRDL
jgi:hypothetical protein